MGDQHAGSVIRRGPRKNEARAEIHWITNESVWTSDNQPSRRIKWGLSALSHEDKSENAPCSQHRPDGRKKDAERFEHAPLDEGVKPEIESMRAGRNMSRRPTKKVA